VSEGPIENLGARLRELRRRAGLTGVQFGERAGMSQSKVSKIETGRRLPTDEDLERIGQALSLSRTERARLRDQVRRLRATFVPIQDAGAATYVRTQREVGRLEREAQLLRDFVATIVPGLLQTADYARALFASFSDVDPAPAVAARLERQTILFEPGRRFVFLVPELALLARYLGPAGMAAQLDRLLQVASLPTVELHVVPRHAILPTPPMAGFSIYDDALVAEETNTGQVMIRDPSRVAEYVDLFQRFLEVAPAEGAPQIIRGLLAELQAEMVGDA
jgi:transcriptional regulator with XRE-family HTH domain